MNQKIDKYLNSDCGRFFSPLFRVNKTQILNEGEVNYVITSLLKAFKNINVEEAEYHKYKKVLAVSAAFSNSTKNVNTILKGIAGCIELELIQHNLMTNEITLLDKCFEEGVLY